MENISVNNNGYSQYVPQIKVNKKQQPFRQNVQAAYSYPVYAQVPYGINKLDYIKTGIQKLPSGDILHTYTLTTGQKIGIVKSSFNCPMIYNRVNTGAYDEPDGKEGISHLTEHSIYHESKKYPQGVDEYIKSIGGYSNAHTNGYETCYYIQLNDSSQLDKALDVNADMLYNPLFTKLDKEKPIVLSEVKERQADELGNLIRNIDAALLSINKPDIKNLTTGSVESVNSISKEDILDYHSKHYTPSNITTVILSDKEPDELINTVAAKFKQVSKDKIYPPAPKKVYNTINTVKRQDIISKDSTKKKLEIGLRIPTLSKEEEIKLQALLEYIKLNLNFDYDYSSLYGNSDCLMFEYTEDNFSEYEAFEYLKEGLNKIAKNPPDESEMKYLIAGMNTLCDTDYKNSDAQAAAICSELATNRFSFNDKDIINNLKKEDIVDALKYIDFSKCSISVLHPKNTTKEEMDNNLKQYQKYIRPVLIPFEFQNIDIRNSIAAHNIKPYISSNIYSSVLPDNTNLYMTNSKNDNCNICWLLNNQNANKYNPAIKYILNEMDGSLAIDDIVKNLKEGTKTTVNYADDGIVMIVNCSKDNIESAVKSLKNDLRVDFSEKNFKEAKQKALSNIKAQKESSSDKRNLEKHGISALKNPEKLEHELEKVTINDVREYYSELINNSYSIVSVNAPFDKNPELFNKTASLLNFPNMKFKEKDNSCFENFYTENQQTSIYLATDENKQSEFEKVYDFKISSNPQDEIRFELLSKVLNKRIYDDLREKQGLAYSAYAYYDKYQNNGKIGIFLSSDCKNEDDIKKVFKGIDINIKKLISEPITQKELKEAKEAFKKDMLTSFDNFDDTHTKILEAAAEPSGLELYKNNFEMIDKVTSQDINKTANYVFKNKPDYLIDAPKDFIDKHREYFKTLGEVKE